MAAARQAGATENSRPLQQARSTPVRSVVQNDPARSASLSARHARAIRSQPEESDYYLVLFSSELVDGASCGFAHHTVSDGLPEFRSYLGIPESLHHRCKRVHELLHEVFDAARSPAYMPLQALAHHTPAKSGSVTDSGVGFLDAQHVLFDQIEHFSVQCCL